MQEIVRISFEEKIKLINISPNFKIFLNQLNELFQNLPETFVIYYSFPDQTRRGIYIGCPADYRVYLRKLSFHEFGNNYQPLLRILPRETEKVFNNTLVDLEKSQKEDYKVYSQIESSLNDGSNSPSQNSLQRIPSFEYMGYHKCQLCYKPLQDYFRCLTCFFFQLCEECNQKSRYQHHSQLHLFILIRSGKVEFDELKTQTIDKIQKQKRRFSFNIHQKNIHEQIQCDICNQAPIIGKRYKCLDCQDYDLCQKCFEKNEHKAEKHNFIQMDYSLEFIQI